MNEKREWKQISWKSPSNIALIKYWGKKFEQLPLNPSLSITLKHCHTVTSIKYRLKKQQKSQMIFNSRSADKQESISKFISRIGQDYPILSEFDYQINTHNSFPTAAGIASSASGMSALALCLGTIIKESTDLTIDFRNFVSELARLGSGSASRSLIGGLAVWGQCEGTIYQDHYSTPVGFDVAPIFRDLQDAVLIVDDRKKSQSSRLGHQQMNQNPYKDIRLKVVKERFIKLLSIMRSGNWKEFSDLVVKEAWELHGMMLLSDPPFTLLRPSTLELISLIENKRIGGSLQCSWTLDAGPNIHLLFPKQEKSKVEEFVKTQCLPYLVGQKVIWDESGDGPELMEFT